MRPSELSREDHERLQTASWLPEVGPFSAFGQSWSLLTDDEAFAALIGDLYADLAVDGVVGRQGTTARATFRALSGTGHRNSLVTRDERPIGGGNAPAAMMAALVWGVNRWVLDAASRGSLLLHAGGIVGAGGTAVLLPAPSNAGKTTLTTGLLGSGLGYLSDEAVAIHVDGTVTGYAKPLSIDPGAWGVLAAHKPRRSAEQLAYLDRQWHVRASQISRTVRHGRLGAVVFPRYTPGCDSTLTLLSPSEALVHAGNCTFGPGNGRRVELAQMRDLAIAMAGIPSYMLVAGDLHTACSAVLDVLASTSR